MFSTKVRVITTFAFLASLLWIFALGWSMKDYLLGATSNTTIQRSEEQVPENAKAINIVAIGDSLTRGTGDIEGKGYVGYVTDQLKQKQIGQEVTLINLAIKGLTAPELAEQLKQKEVLRQIGQADLVMMTIGGNDLFHGGQSLSDLSEANILRLQQSYLKHLKSILTNIRAVNKEATIYLVGLYNPFSAFENGELMSSVVRDWNYNTTETAAQFAKTVFVPTYDLFQLQAADFLFTDQFHPNEIGYQLIADRVAALVTQAGGQR